MDERHDEEVKKEVYLFNYLLSMRAVQLKGKRGEGKVALVDDDDFESVSRFTWYFSSAGYPVANTIRNGKCFTLCMHRLIMAAADGEELDHINRDPLDNRRCNLRFCTRSQNVANTRKHSNNTSGFKGVSWHKSSMKWRAVIRANGKNVHIGSFARIEDAVAAHALKAIEVFGEFGYSDL